MTEEAAEVVAGSRAAVKSAQRAIQLIETLAGQGERLTATELQAVTGLPRSSLHGLLHTLLEAGWLEVEPGSAAYGLGVRALVCGTSYLDRDPAAPYAREAVESVRDEVGFTTHFARRIGADVVYLMTRESRSAIHRSRIGRTLPAHATALGKALLAELTRGEFDALLPDPLPALTPNTLTDPELLWADCVASRDRGYGAEIEEGSPGVRCVAAAVPYRIPATDALSCSIPIDHVTPDEVGRVTEVLVASAADLGARLRHAGIR
ncbi:IclR family transcriptional regulator [Pseudonocardia sp. HH130630-07]|uniref:IclR family transcriptional regulator n=1 Tax=Pseudonocardia sp. HH130630-07 TaxID=1690815 RepID=UPI000AC3EB77|nr:IclR family transcriptional regulator [Pseudonocardia sp. HH130630-07]